MDELERIKVYIALGALFVGALGLGIPFASGWAVQKIIENRERRGEVKKLLLDLTTAIVDYSDAVCMSVVFTVSAKAAQNVFDDWVTKAATTDIIDKALAFSTDEWEKASAKRHELHVAQWKLRTLWRCVFLIFDRSGEPLQDAIDVLFKKGDEVLARTDWTPEFLQREIDDVERNVFPPLMNAIDQEAGRLWDDVKTRRLWLSAPCADASGR